MKSGKLAETILKRSVLKEIKQGKRNESAVIGSDCAFFSIPENKKAVWRAQEAAVAMEADMASLDQLICKCANNLAAAGAKPVSAQITVMLPENCEEPFVKELAQSAAKALSELGIEAVGGDTNVSYAVNAPIASVALMGLVDEGQEHTSALAKPGQDIVLSKWIGLEGTSVLAKAFHDGLLTRYPAYLAEEAESFDGYLSVAKEAEIAMQNGVMAMHDLSQGGIFGGLWELAEGTGLGLTVDLKKIPIRQETVEVCEFCGVNPYEMRSGGSLLMTAAKGQELVDALAREGIPAAVIGSLTDKNDRIVVNEDETRYLVRPTGEDAITEAIRNLRNTDTKRS